VLRRIFGPKRDEVTGEWRRLHNKELYAVYSSPNIIRVIKSRRLRWAGHVARIGDRRGDIYVMYYITYLKASRSQTHVAVNISLFLL
jgi:hypothetical protein